MCDLIFDQSVFCVKGCTLSQYIYLLCDIYLKQIMSASTLECISVLKCCLQKEFCNMPARHTSVTENLWPDCYLNDTKITHIAVLLK